jgi:predicted nucleotidyltransferase
MPSDNNALFTKENLDIYLKELGKEFRKRNGKEAFAEVVLVGGAAVLANYGFRYSTGDVDALVQTTSTLEDAITCVGDKFALPKDWLNDDFIRTKSYSEKLREISTYYRTFSNVLEVRCVKAEYLVAMKLRSGRKYKIDFSDVIGILAEEEKRNCPLSWEQIDGAVKKLYDNWDGMPKDSKQFIKDVLYSKNYTKAFEDIVASEEQTKNILLVYDQSHPNVIKEENVDEIVAFMKAKETAHSIQSKKPETKK